jgi:dTDP-4-amino-4,6-dideoxygalactose transaminase
MGGNLQVKAPEYLVPILVPAMPRTESILQYLKEIEDNRVYSNFGPLATSLEKRLASLFGVPQENVVSCANATLGLIGAIQTSKSVTKQNGWQCPSWTFAATAHALEQSGCNFAFIDINEKWRGNFIDHANFRNFIEIAPFGDLPNSPTQTNYENFDVKIVDAAASLLSAMEKNLVLEKNTGYVFSLHATKLVGAGEGGIFIASDPSWAQRFRQWSNFGFGNSREAINKGLNAKMSEYTAAVALASLDGMEETKAKLWRLRNWALDQTKKIGLNAHGALENGLYSPYWIVELENAQVRTLLDSILNERGIETRKWWSNGCHKMPHFRNRKVLTNLRKTDVVASRTTALPFFPDLTDKQMKIIELGLNEFGKQLLKN